MVPAGVAAIVVCGAALWLLRSVDDAHASAAATREISNDTPAANALPALKLRLFYASLLLDGLLSLAVRGDPSLYVTLLLVFASVPILGHQSIGLTPARHRSTVVHRWWWLGWCFPLLTTAFGVWLLIERRVIG